MAGAAVEPEPFDPVIHGILLGGVEPLYLSASIAGGHGLAAAVSGTSTWSTATKVAARYLAPYLDERDRLTGGAL